MLPMDGCAGGLLPADLPVVVIIIHQTDDVSRSNTTNLVEKFFQ
jgi:hypothetical protein